MFIRTFFVRGKNGGDGSDFGKVRVGEFLAETDELKKAAPCPGARTWDSGGDFIGEAFRSGGCRDVVLR